MIKGYKEMTLDMYFQITEILETDLELIDKEVAIIAIMDNKTQDEVLNMELMDFNNRVNALAFLTTQPQRFMPDMKYKIDGQTFEVMASTDEMTVAQYVDYNAYLQMEDEREKILGFLSVFMIPKGKKYGEYKMDEVKEKLMKMNVEDVYALSAFFLEWSKALTKTTQTYLMKKMRKMIKKEKNPQTRQQMMEALEHLQETGDILP